MKISKLDPEFCDAIPQKENMRHGVLYICMACDVAGHLCPCGCGEEVITMFHPKRGWTISYDGKGLRFHHLLEIGTVLVHHIIGFEITKSSGVAKKSLTLVSPDLIG